MKRLTLIIAVILLQVSTLFAQGPVTRVNSEKVKMYRQPGLSAEVMRLLNTEDDIVVLRKFNGEWSLVQIEGEGGYVLNSVLKAKKAKKGSTAKNTSEATPRASRH